MLFIVSVDPVPKEEIDLTTGIYAADIPLHAALIAVVKYNDFSSRLYLSSPFAPKQAAAGEMEQVCYFVNQVAKAGLGNAEGSKHPATVMRKEIVFRFFKYKYDTWWLHGGLSDLIYIIIIRRPERDCQGEKSVLYLIRRHLKYLQIRQGRIDENETERDISQYHCSGV